MQSLTFIESLHSTQLTNIIATLEKGMELDKLEYLATNDPKTRTRISDSCLLLSFLYFRQMSRCPS